MRDVVIIGGGIAGLSAGIFAQKNGFASVIVEKNPILGGECAGWDRKGYHIDGCIHWLVGTKEGTPLHGLWAAVGALDGVEIYSPESFLAHEYDGIAVHFYRDLERLKSSWLEISPQDEGAIMDFCQSIVALQSYEIPVDRPMDQMTMVEKIKHMFSMKEVGMAMKKYGRLSLKEYAKNFQHPALQDALASFMPEGYSAMSILFALATFTKDQASIPYGGSKALAMRMADRYLSLGGTIEASCEVVSLKQERDRAKGVILSNDREFEGDYFIAACDAKVLYERLLKGERNDPAYERRYQNPKDYPLASNIYLGIGYEGSMDDLPRTLRFPIKPFTIHQAPITSLQLTHYSYEPSFAPKGHTLITIAINQFYEDYNAWHALAVDPKAYREEKRRIGEEVQRAIASRFPYMEGKLKVLDVATPKTYERYCNAYRGAFMPFLPTTKGKMMAHTGKIKGLKNVVLSGQWLQPPGGLPVALITGKDTIMRLCREEGRAFIGH